MSRRNLGIMLVAIALTLPATAEESVLVEIGDLHPGTLERQSFEIDRAQEVRIGAVGPDGRHDGERWADVWILDAASREVMWELEDADSSYHGRDLRDFEDRVELEPGIYEVYYAVRPLDRVELDGDRWWHSLARSVVGVFESFEELVDELSLEVSAEGRVVSSQRIETARSPWSTDALVSLTGLHDGEMASRGFRLDRPAKVEIYTVGEATRDGSYDYGWIVDLATRERIWDFDYRRSDEAGGARKNRVLRTSLKLDAGSYAAFFTTDGSHSPERWNVLPPRDPDFWGLTLRVSPEDRAQARAFEHRYLPEELVLAEIVGLRDDDRESQSFTVKAPVDVRVFAVGEGTRRGLYDYGWIRDTRTHETVWTMEDAETRHAGGAQKNLVADEIVHLEPGSYELIYVTDDSHSYRRWNSDPPAFPERWGITLLAPDESFDPSAVVRAGGAPAGEHG